MNGRFTKKSASKLTLLFKIEESGISTLPKYYLNIKKTSEQLY